MSANENNDAAVTAADEEAVSDREKARCRRNRRPSVQFIDKNLIRRRSLGAEKSTQQPFFQQSRLPSIHGNDEVETNDADPSQQPDCENAFPRCQCELEIIIVDKRETAREYTPDFHQGSLLFLSLILATASDTDSDLEDGTGPNIRELQHVS